MWRGIIATDSPHFITSPGFPSLLGDNEICRWSIVAANDSQISIKFPSFDVASRSAQGDCSQGVLHLYERSVSRDSYYCGNVSIPEYKSLTSTVVVLLTTNSPSGGGTGFRLSYQIASCNQTYSESSGQILSPGWPGNYPHLSNCQMLIEAPSGYSVSLYFHIFSLESHEQCAFDDLQVFNGSSDTGPLLFTLCGPTLPSPIFTPSNALLLRFTSDDSLAQSGFHLTYTSSPLGCGGNLTGSSGTFTSHLYPSPPPANSTCSWLIIAHQGSHVVEFENFDVLKEPGHFGCSNNFVVVYDGRTESSPIIATYCGEDRPSQISSSGSYLLVKHVSGSGLIGSGFKATYHPRP
ncbi:hypothetical protein CAPTEDRAFT_224894 [Capitella teleta]|uniref:CUB domain-containing protein n=1 Tax=Capitella teleta TaxID=283909 RepID=R7TLQ4_CAPTE|nr:hypothetical protein CAPTEDRAFT_224894 [Capitella teleta]|eukprot:ELT94437.1 hypothetical protein CAPTEDRAFT_224894 [Capitella teleta]